jgi:hypothetical protein
MWLIFTHGPAALVGPDRNYPLLNDCWHPLPMAQLHEFGRRPQWPPTVREVVENISPINGNAGYPTPTVGGPGAPSCYRVSLLSGAVEVTARLKCCDDLDLLLKVLEANRALFVRADRLANEILTLSDQQAVAPAAVAIRTAEAAA